MISPVSTPTPSQSPSQRMIPSQGRTPSKRIHARQVPIDTSHVTEIWIDLPTSVFIKVVATNDQTVGTFNSYTEYWYASTASLQGVEELAFASQSGSYTSTQINQFIGTISPAFQWTQNIGTQGWTQGTYTPPTGRQARLYKAPDPDQSGRQIGLLIEQDSYNNLVGITWYKQENTGKIFDTTPTELTFTLVTNQDDEPSIDPNEIDATTWYYASSSS